MESRGRIERLLALILIQQMKGSQREKALQLNLAGFSNAEIADILQTTSAVIAQSLYSMKGPRRPRKKTK
jgi:DNA-directed RNA polymerase specialized sigma24 family protein